MAAAEYYNPSGGAGSPAPAPQFNSPQTAPSHPSQQHLNPPYPISDAPPPYTEYAQSPAQKPRPPQNTTDQQYRPPLSGQYPSDKDFRPSSLPHQNATFHASDFQRPYGGAPPQQQQSPYLQSQPNHQQRPPFPAQSQSSFLQPTYNNPDVRQRPSSTPAKPHGILKNKYEQSPYRSPSRSRSRSRSRERRHRHHHHRHNSNSHHNSSRPEVKKSSSNSVKTFLGAGGGAIIGDAIFPGLGTIGGAILGGLSGHEYGKRRKDYDDAARLAPPKDKTRRWSNEGDYYYDEDGRRGRRY